MVEIAGLNYEIIIGSDLQRDGMYLEVWNEANTVVAEVFYSDQNNQMTFTGYIPDLPLPLVEWMIESAKARLAPEQSNGN